MVQRIVPIFSGGGTRLPAHIGILRALEEIDVEFDSMVGISGGSIVAALYACKMPLEKILALATSTDFKQFRDFSLIRLLLHGGLSSGKKFESWLDKLLEGKTFADLDFSLHVIATDLNGGGPVVFNKANSPEMKISQAVRYSMSIPLIFSSTVYKKHLLVDGAILSEDALFNDWQGDGTPNVCFRLRSQLSAPSFDHRKRFMLPQYITMLIRTFMTALSREYVHANFWHHTVVIDTGNMSAVDFAMTPEQKTMLYNAGYETVKQFLPAKLAQLKH
ncbi:phospholipase [Alteromonas sediminis]|uniref:Phospholipase n=1 Tax=Alteromonas sediminis TaxID=2259342 RepID=A0A3N5XXI9_9ALTE|nr:patatin-like phospholipase family protein [Alteromonas sediminis]RPJ65707.1 phospholipase [Alteromonas sediminis]